jgi:hypothetical protein
MSEHAKCPTCSTPLGGRWGNRCYRCNGRPRTGEEKQCRICEKAFYAAAWQLRDIERNQGAYCSRACKYEALRLDTRPPEGFKWCTKCGQLKRLDDFSPDKRTKDQRQSQCKDCKRLWAQRDREVHPERWQEVAARFNERRKPDRSWRRTAVDYNLTRQEFEALLAGQGGGCAICGGQPNGRSVRLHIDHDHNCCPGIGSCGKCIRGLLCSNCNTMIGLAKDDPERLLTAVRYLRQSRRVEAMAEVRQHVDD